MSTGQLRAIAIALALLLVLWGAGRFLSHRSDTVQGSLALPKLREETVDSIVVRHGQDTVTLARSGSTWTVDGHPAATRMVADFFQALADTATPDLAAVSRTSFDRLGVDSQGGYWLRVMRRGQPALHLVIGKPGFGMTGGYVRREGSDSVLLLRGMLPSVVRRGRDEWRDHRVAAVVPESVQTISVLQSVRPYTLRRAGATWRFADGSTADSGKVAALLGQYRDLEANGFGTVAQVDSGKAKGKGKSVHRTVTLSGAGGKPLLLLTLDSTASGVWARRPGDETAYRFEDWRSSAVVPSDTALRPLRAPAPSPAAPHH